MRVSLLGLVSLAFLAVVSARPGTAAGGGEAPAKNKGQEQKEPSVTVCSSVAGAIKCARVNRADFDSAIPTDTAKVGAGGFKSIRLAGLNTHITKRPEVHNRSRKTGRFISHNRSQITGRFAENGRSRKTGRFNSKNRDAVSGRYEKDHTPKSKQAKQAKAGNKGPNAAAKKSLLELEDPAPAANGAGNASNQPEQKEDGAVYVCEADPAKVNAGPSNCNWVSADAAKRAGLKVVKNADGSVPEPAAFGGNLAKLNQAVKKRWEVRNRSRKTGRFISHNRSQITGRFAENGRSRKTGRFNSKNRDAVSGRYEKDHTPKSKLRGRKTGAKAAPNKPVNTPANGATPANK